MEIKTREASHDNGAKQEMKEGVKYDTEKPKWELLDTDFVEGIVKVLTYGAKKYAPDNWKRVDQLRDRYYAAAMRHIMAWRRGEQTDPESGIDHLAHAACSLMFCYWKDHNKEQE